MGDWKLGQMNKAEIYIMPMLGGNLRHYKNKDVNYLPQSRFVNCFSGDKVRGIEDKILLLYRYSGQKEYVNFENQFIQTHKDFHSMYEPDNFHTMYVFNIPEEEKACYDILLSGKYSKLPSSFKQQILQFHNLTEHSAVAGVLYKTEERYQFVEHEILGERTGFIDREDSDIELSPKIQAEPQNYFQEGYIKKQVLLNQ